MKLKLAFTSLENSRRQIICRATKGKRLHYSKSSVTSTLLIATFKEFFSWYPLFHMRFWTRWPLKLSLFDYIKIDMNKLLWNIYTNVNSNFAKAAYDSHWYEVEVEGVPSRMANVTWH
jgi:hypothetical protein